MDKTKEKGGSPKEARLELVVFLFKKLKTRTPTFQGLQLNKHQVAG